MIRLEEVSKSFGENLAVRSTSLSLPPEKTLALIGPSGCGKSTLLRLILGLIPPDEGRVIVDDTTVSPDTCPKVRQKIGYVIQDGGLFPHLTAGQNISLMADYLHWDRPKVRSRIMELCELTSFSSELIDRYPTQLSGGQRQRVGLMRGLMLDPDFLLMDEPLGALDPMIRTQLQEDLREIFRTLNKTVLLVTHDMSEAAYLGDVIALMRNGEIIQKGTVRELLHAPANPFVTEFIRSQRPLWAEEAER